MIAIEIDAIVPDLKRLAADKAGEITAFITFGLEGEMSRLMADSQPTGKIYPRGKSAHQASAPGEPPAVDTTNLLTSISGEVFESEMKGEITMAEYGGFLEFGTNRIEPRPFLIPSLDEIVKEIANGQP